MLSTSVKEGLAEGAEDEQPKAIEFREVKVIDLTKRTADVQSDVTFESLMVSNEVQESLKRHGFFRASPVQAEALPLAMLGMDLVVQAKTGTGKTLVFAILAVNNYLLQMERRHKFPHVLVVSPTREVAQQNFDFIRKICPKGFYCGLFVGGTDVNADKALLEKGCQVAVGTCGRLIQLIKMKVLKISKTTLFVLDEADKLMDDASAEINYIFSGLPKEGVQTCVFSATYPRNIEKVLCNYMHDPTLIRVNSGDIQLIGVKQYAIFAPFMSFADVISQLLKSVTFGQAIIFVNDKEKHVELCEKLRDRGVEQVEYFSAALSQDQRSDLIKKLKNYKIRVIISSDVMSRGVDVPNVNLVINAGCPVSVDTYLHRIGRSGRYGSKGVAITVLCNKSQNVRFRKFIREGELKVKQLDPSKSYPSDLAADAAFFEASEDFLKPREEDIETDTVDDLSSRLETSAASSARKKSFSRKKTAPPPPGQTLDPRHNKQLVSYKDLDTFSKTPTPIQNQKKGFGKSLRTTNKKASIEESSPVSQPKPSPRPASASRSLVPIKPTDEEKKLMEKQAQELLAEEESGESGAEVEDSWVQLQPAAAENAQLQPVHVSVEAAEPVAEKKTDAGSSGSSFYLPEPHDFVPNVQSDEEAKSPEKPMDSPPILDQKDTANETDYEDFRPDTQSPECPYVPPHLREQSKSDEVKTPSAVQPQEEGNAGQNPTAIGDEAAGKEDDVVQSEFMAKVKQMEGMDILDANLQAHAKKSSTSSASSTKSMTVKELADVLELDKASQNVRTTITAPPPMSEAEAVLKTKQYTRDEMLALRDSKNEDEVFLESVTVKEVADVLLNKAPQDIRTTNVLELEKAPQSVRTKIIVPPLPPVEAAPKHYSRDEMMAMRDSRNEDEWLCYLYNNHKDTWDISDFPFELDKAMRCPLAMQLRVLRAREAEERKWAAAGTKIEEPVPTQQQAKKAIAKTQQPKKDKKQWGQPFNWKERNLQQHNHSGEGEARKLLSALQLPMRKPPSQQKAVVTAPISSTLPKGYFAYKKSYAQKSTTTEFTGPSAADLEQFAQIWNAYLKHINRGIAEFHRRTAR